LIDHARGEPLVGEFDLTLITLKRIFFSLLSYLEKNV